MVRNPTGKQIAFADWLTRLAESDERGTLAALRRGLMLDEEHLFELYGYLPPRFLAGLAPGTERLYLMVAALFGYHSAGFTKDQLQERRRNLGESLRLMALERRTPTGPTDDEELLPDSLKRRVEALLAARDDLYGHLRQAVSLLKTVEIPVDWALLMSDLQAWDWQGRPVQWAWSRSFYIGHQDKGGDESHVS